MRLIYSLPKLGDTLSHDSPLLKIIRVAVPAFIFISAVTVFWGVKAHISQYLAYYSPWIQYPAFSIGFLLFSLAPDALNAILVAYVARSILKRKFDHLSIILMIFCSLLSVGLTIYSYQMSKFSAVEAANEASGEAETIDLTPIDAKYDAALQRIQDDYNGEKQTIESNYAALIETENQSIASWEKKRNDGNTHWIDRQQDRRRKSIATLLEKQKSDLEALRSRKQAKQDEAGAQHQKDRTKAESRNNGEETRHESFAAIFASKLSWLSGNAVFVVLILTCIREILYNRNDVEIKPVFGQFDFQPSPILETLALPFTTAGRYIINAVRAAYESLPELKQRPDFEPVTDYSNYQQKVNTPNGKNAQQAQGAPTPSTRQTAKPQQSDQDDIWKDLMHDIDMDTLFNGSSYSQNAAQTVAPNPSAIFTNPQRITIRGFQPHKIEVSEPANKPVNNRSVSGNGLAKKICDHCGVEYQPKTWNQRFCSNKGEGNCKDAWHEAKHGQRFNPKQYHKTKKS